MYSTTFKNNKKLKNELGNDKNCHRCDFTQNMLINHSRCAGERTGFINCKREVFLSGDGFLLIKTLRTHMIRF